jgi:membrane-bound inhibitor of C-type lysozyme
MRSTLFGLAAAILAATPAVSLQLDLPGEEQRFPVHYVCDGGVEFDVEFINVGDTSLALLMIDGTTTLLANVISGSGARYAGGAYELWSKGDDATFRDLMGDSPDGIACRGG